MHERTTGLGNGREQQVGANGNVKGKAEGEQQGRHERTTTDPGHADRETDNGAGEDIAEELHLMSCPGGIGCKSTVMELFWKRIFVDIFRRLVNIGIRHHTEVKPHETSAITLYLGSRPPRPQRLRHRPKPVHLAARDQQADTPAGG